MFDLIVIGILTKLILLRPIKMCKFAFSFPGLRAVLILSQQSQYMKKCIVISHIQLNR
jgi:hypothetical protein